MEMDEAPCGYVSVDDQGEMVAINQTLLLLLGYERDQLQSKHINEILPNSSQAFYQIYFFPIIKVHKKIEEMYIVLKAKDNRQIPVLLNAKRNNRDDKIYNDCLFIPMYKRNEFEKEILRAKKEAERLLQENQQYEKQLREQLELARKIQAISIALPNADEQIRMETYYQPSEVLSGDIFGYYPVSETKYALVILDVMGHGISSALVTMYLRSAYQANISTELPVNQAVEQLDQLLHMLFRDHNEVRHYATMIYMVIDTAMKQIEYINAGHPAAILLDGNTPVHLESTIPPIGLFEGIYFESKIQPYVSGSRLILYTDGVTDRIEPPIFLELLQETKDKPLEEVKGKILEVLKEETALSVVDDQCFILLDL